MSKCNNLLTSSGELFGGENYWCDYKEGPVTKEDYIEFCRYDDGWRYESHGRRCPAHRHGGCYLTTACVKSKNLSDDCHELTVLRDFRDNWLESQEGGKHEICWYYHTAPRIVERIDQEKDSKEIWNSVYEELVAPCVELIESGRNHEAYAIYKEYTFKLAEKYLS